ncbi:MAG: hypothetical protein UY85_C0034G0007 [Candidatus Peribacteria bacterium GW2011_GWB1_54_5]|nr:MAG: hypothetical protein UY85_C0034G0007 [Candidatus Peribacteria bacterium GW2011_GWB1_54_5]
MLLMSSSISVTDCTSTAWHSRESAQTERYHTKEKDEPTYSSLRAGVAIGEQTLSNSSMCIHTRSQMRRSLYNVIIPEGRNLSILSRRMHSSARKCRAVLASQIRISPMTMHPGRGDENARLGHDCHTDALPSHPHSMVPGALRPATAVATAVASSERPLFYSHSIVPGGLLVRSRNTRSIPCNCMMRSVMR